MDDLRRRTKEFVDDFPSELDFSASLIELARRQHGKEFPENALPIVHDILVRIRKGIAPVMPRRGMTPFEIERERQQLGEFLRVRDREGYVTATLVTMSSFVSHILEHIPPSRPSSLTASLTSAIQNFPVFIDRLIEPFFYPGVVKAETFESLRRQLWANICLASGMPIDSKHTPRHIWPEHSKLPRNDLFHAYLKDTPLQRLSRLRVPVAIPRNLLAEHTAIFAPSGHGKSQLMQALVHDLLQDDPPGMIIMDSHGDLIRNLRPIIPKDRLVVLDPETEPPALNLFAISGGMANELFAYLFTALDRTLTEKQLTTVIYALRLLQALPRPTLTTFLEVLNDRAKTIAESKYASAIAKLDGVTQAFFATQYFDRENSGTRQQVANRLFTVLSNPIFEKMFNAKENTFDAFSTMQSEKIVLVNTSMLTLRQQGSSVFGRYIIAQYLSAAYQRATLPPSQRRLCVMFIDEAAQYFDDTTETILSEARKYGLGLMFATQHLEQLPDNVKRSMAGNTATKIVGPVSMQDARYLAHEMRTSPEFLRSMKKEKSHSEFGMYIRNTTATALRVQVPFGIVESAPRDDTPSSPPPATPVTTAAGHDDADVTIDNDIDHTAPTAWNQST